MDNRRRRDPANHPSRTSNLNHVRVYPILTAPASITLFVRRHATASTARDLPFIMTYHNRRGKDHTLLESPADWISPNSEGGFRDDPPDLQGAKVVLSDTDHLWGNRVFQQHTAAVTVEDGERNVVARQLQISDAPSRIGPAEIARLASARSAYR